jgi:hypothetical protein
MGKGKAAKGKRGGKLKLFGKKGARGNKVTETGGKHRKPKPWTPKIGNNY